MTFEEWCGGFEEWIIDSSTMRFARATWEAATQAERELTKKVLKSQSEAHIRNLQAAVEAEREACAKLCEELAEGFRYEHDTAAEHAGDECARVIRARSTKP
jgi:hypothetical protein